MGTFYYPKTATLKRSVIGNTAKTAGRKVGRKRGRGLKSSLLDVGRKALSSGTKHFSKELSRSGSLKKALVRGGKAALHRASSEGTRKLEGSSSRRRSKSSSSSRSRSSSSSSARRSGGVRRRKGSGLKKVSVKGHTRSFPRTVTKKRKKK